MSRGTTIRAVRVADDPWEPALARARREGGTVTAVVVAALTAYARGDDTLTLAPPGSVPRRAGAGVR